jgi:hypothetical protein
MQYSTAMFTSFVSYSRVCRNPYSNIRHKYARHMMGILFLNREYSLTSHP